MHLLYLDESGSAADPLYLDSRASRLIQLADLVAFALFRFYEAGDRIFYDLIKDSFDSEGGVQHGLHVKE